MKYIRVVSDIHLDFDIVVANVTRKSRMQHELRDQEEIDVLWLPPQLPEDKETTLAIAGDLWVARKFIRRVDRDGRSWLKKVSEQFKYVVFVLGNHDYWGDNLTLAHASIRKKITEQGIGNVFLLEKSFVVLDQVKFVGGTMWTNYDNRDPIAMLRAPMVMVPDFTKIKIGTGYGRLKVEHLLAQFDKTKNFILTNGVKDNPEQRVVAITHHAPTYMSMGTFWKGSPWNPFYYSDLTPELCYTAEHDIELWFHGHSHSQADYSIGTRKDKDLRVIANPRGYVGFENTNFNPTLRFEV